MVKQVWLFDKGGLAMKWTIDDLLNSLCLLDKDGIDGLNRSEISKEISDRLKYGDPREQRLIARHSSQVIMKLSGEAIMALKNLNDANGGDYITKAKQEEGKACNFWDSS